MPDDWEFALCLDPCDPNDRNGDRDGDGYTNIEEYLNWLPMGDSVPKKTDVDCDYIVNFRDFSEFAQHWLGSAGSPLYDERYDFDPVNGMISMDDLSFIAEDWLTVGGEY